MAALDVKRHNVGLMQAERGYDVTIVCTSDAEQAAFWQERLEQARGSVIPSSSAVVAVDEEWDGGAGNFLGTLYAWRKACAKHKELTNSDLAAALKGGASVALYHTAGKGTRLAPLPGAENNNKPGVKLPAPGAPSILECVIKQTGAYASSRKKRLSVFWGDQVFVPSVAAEYQPQYHVDILCALGPMPTAEDWKARGLQSYGLIAARGDKSVAIMLEKVDHDSATKQLSQLGGVECVGPSVGSFSLSSAFLAALDGAFAVELGAKRGKMDSDPHMWMPMTCGREDYARLMVSKGLFDEAGASAHHDRVTRIIAAFPVDSDGLGGMFGAVNVGTDFSWWDYGQVKLFYRNSMLLTEDSEDSQLARSFWSVPEKGRTVGGAEALGACVVDSASVVSGTTAASGSVSASMVCGVATSELRADGAVLVNVCARRVVAAKGAIVYNVVDSSEEGVVVGENEVRVGVFTPSAERPYFEMRSHMLDVDGGKAFKEKVCGNAFSFQEVYDMNHGVDVRACAAIGRRVFQARAELLKK